MKVLVFLNGLTYGGIEVMFRDVLPTLMDRGVHLDFCCTGPRCFLDDEIEKRGSRIFRIPKSANPYRTARYVRELLEQYSCDYGYDYDVVHSQFGYTSGGMALGARQRGVPVAVSFHASTPTSLISWKNRPILHQLRNLWLRLHRTLLMRYADLFVGHSESILDAFDVGWRDVPERFQVLYNGVAFSSEVLDRKACRGRLGFTDEQTVILHVGSFRPEKNHLGLLEIFEKVREADATAILLLVGSGGMFERVRKEVSRRGLDEAVRFEGVQRDVWKYYCAADVLLFPSETEGFGNVIVEAQAAGLPVVASDIPAHRESLDASQHRFLFPLSDYACAARLVGERLCGDHSGVQESKNNVWRDYSIERLADDLVAMYHRLG